VIKCDAAMGCCTASSIGGRSVRTAGGAARPQGFGRSQRGWEINGFWDMDPLY
jgi:hypothetical protein